MPKNLSGIFLLLILLFSLPAPVNAQTTARAALTQLQSEAFPQVEAFLRIWDDQGRFMHGFNAPDIQVLENDQLIKVHHAQEIHPGVQMVVVVNPGATFATRNRQGVLRSDAILEVLTQWAENRRGSNLDDWSLLAPNAPEANHLNKPDDWLIALKKVSLDAQTTAPNLDMLSRAIDLASDPTRRPGVARAVLFITPPLESRSGVPLENFSARAIQQGVQIFVWMVASPGSYSTQAALQLQQLASQTGGQFANFTGSYPMPDPEEFLEPFRSVYHLVYTSQLKTTGVFPVTVEVNTVLGKISSSTQTLDIKINPPDPAFVAPPLEIRRQAVKPSTKEQSDSQDKVDYLPVEQTLQIVVGFPDERIRPIVRTTLFVDGQPAVENRAAPFDRFTWHLGNITTSGAHSLRVEAEDHLGLVGSSIETIVQVVVEPPKTDPWAWIYHNIPVLSLLAVGLAGAIVFLVLVLGGRLHPYAGRAGKPRRRSDPVTQPVRVKHEVAQRKITRLDNPRLPLRLPLHWPQRRVAPKAYGFLTRISDTDDLGQSAPLPIMTDEITLGGDPSQSTMVVDDPSVEALHARLTRQEDGSFKLADQGSIAGTWINYTPVSREGAILEPGDLIHIGRIGFRFNLQQASASRKPVAVPLESIEPAHQAAVKAPDQASGKENS